MLLSLLSLPSQSFKLNFASLDLKWKRASALLQSGFGSSYLYHHFYLKPTRCAKGSTVSDPQSCPFRNDRVSDFKFQIYKLCSEHHQHIYDMLMFFVIDFTAADGLCSLLQNSKQPNGIRPQAVRALYSEAKTQWGIHGFMSSLVVTSLCGGEIYEQENNASQLCICSYNVLIFKLNLWVWFKACRDSSLNVKVFKGLGANWLLCICCFLHTTLTPWCSLSVSGDEDN